MSFRITGLDPAPFRPPLRTSRRGTRRLGVKRAYVPTRSRAFPIASSCATPSQGEAFCS